MSTVGERLLAARSKAQAAHEITLAIPGFDGQLHATFRPLYFRESRKIGQAHERLSDEIEKELRVAADTLVAACTGCEAHIDGETHTLPPIGMALNEAIGLDAGENDRQAVLALYPTENALIRQFVAVDLAETQANVAVDTQLGKELEGNSEAAS